MADITGTPGPDDITDTPAADIIDLLAGDDILRVVNRPVGFPASATEDYRGGDGYDRMILQFTWQDGGTFDARTGTMGDINGRATFSGFEVFEVRIASPFGMSLRITTLDGDDIAFGGTGFNDMISTGGGNDTIYQISQSDVATGGAGDDTYYVIDTGTVVEDAVGGGIDTVYYSSATYILPQGVERLFATAPDLTFARTFTGNAADNLISAGAGNDTINAEAGGADSLSGLGGNDLFVFGSAFGAGDTVDGGAGTDMVSIAGNYDVLLAGTALTDVETLQLGAGYSYRLVATDAFLSSGGPLTIDGSLLGAGEVLNFDASAETSGSFLIYGGSGDDVIRSGAGNDTLGGGGGIDQMFGGAGDDTYLVFQAEDAVTEYAGEGNDTVYTGVTYHLAPGSSIETLSTIEHRGTAAIGLFGNEFANTLYGNFGNNQLDGLGGADSMHGLAGDDIYIVDDAADRVFEDLGGGNDMVVALTSYVLPAGQEIETLSTRVHASTDAIDFTGNEFANTLYGNFGDNVLNGNAGADTMTGFYGDDSYIVDNAGDQVIESAGQGHDTLYSYVSYTLSNGQEIEVLSTVAHRDTAAIDLLGNDYANLLYGNFGDNYLNGRGGADTMIGFLGNDTYVVDNAGDQIVENAGEGQDSVFTFVNYTLWGGIEVEMLSAASQRDTGNLNLFGNEFAQTVIGNFGNNTLNGGGGSDVLIGLSGFDTFVFSDALGPGNIDRIQDFDPATDTIVLANQVFTGLAEGALDVSAFRIGTAALDADDRILYDSGTGALFFDADGNGGQDAVQFAWVPPNLSLTSADFFII